MRVAIYARISGAARNGEEVSSDSKGQDPGMQTGEMKEYTQRRGWTDVGEYIDIGISGSKDRRPELDRLMADAHRRKFDVVLVWRFDRFARSVSHLLKALETFQSLGIEFVSLSEQMDTSTPTGKMVFTVLGAVAELERSLIVERVKAGMRNAKAKGHLPGRKRQRLDLVAIRGRIKTPLNPQGESMSSVARSINISPALLSKRLRERPAVV
jgi:DNA invertase Pin-like site-specific DNA recombinase